MNARTICLIAALLTAVLLFPYRTARAEVEESAESNGFSVVSSYYELPASVTVMKSFPSGTGDILARFKQNGITLTELPGKVPASDYGFVGLSHASRRLHGTTDAPFSMSMLTIQRLSGIRMSFDEPQCVVAMTLLAPTTDTDIGVDILFLDTKGKLLKRVDADTHQMKADVDYDSRGAVFRGLRSEKPIIGAVDIVLTKVPDNVKGVFLAIDYFCMAKEDGVGTSTSVVKELVAALGDEQFSKRENAAKELSSLGPQVLPILKSMQPVNDPEVRDRLAGIIKALESKKINLTSGGMSD